MAAPTAPAFERLPVLDRRVLAADLPRFAAELRAACSAVGFFVLAGLPERSVALQGEVLRVARDFFALPLEEKSRIDYRHSPQFRGYMRQGAENTAGRPDEREQVELGGEEAAVEGALSAGAPLYERLRGPNQWPDRPPDLRAVVEEWLDDMERLARELTQALSVSLGLQPHALDALFARPHVQAKLVHYPATQLGPGGAEAAADGELGVGPHSDSGFLTLLLQDEVGGLEVLNCSGQWIPAQPMPGTLVCNLGEVLQLLSGGEYLSTVHRVKRPLQGRVSAPYFWNPSLDVVVQPLPGREDRQLSEATGRPSAAANRLLPSYGMNAFKSLARSHPAVFQRHHPDLKCLPDGQVVAR